MQELVSVMRDRGWVDMTSSESRLFARTRTRARPGVPSQSLPGLAELSRSGGDPHITAHSALSDFINQRYGTSISQGFQHADDWVAFADRAGSARQVFADLDEFYGNWLPSRVGQGHYPSLTGHIDDIRYAYSIDRRWLMDRVRC
jgi:hypothetical protein